MTETTLEEARRCPKCEQPGVLSNVKPLPAGRAVTFGAKLHTFKCENQRCSWYGETCRTVQVNPDGSIPPPLTKRDKEYPKVADLSSQINAQLARQVELETSPDGTAEIRR